MARSPAKTRRAGGRPSAKGEAPRRDPLERYRAKRDFARTPEPRGAAPGKSEGRAFVIQKHDASRLHYDLRLELDGVMRSWAVPKGPSYDPKVKRMAVQTEDHPISYNTFEGTIPAGEYGAGRVIVWDRGTWQPLGDPHEGLERGRFAFALAGQKMHGAWELVRTGKPASKGQAGWLLFKKRDEFARPAAEYDVVRALPDSVIAKPLAPEKEETRREASDGGAPLSRAPKAPLPAKLSPQLATLVTEIPPGDWIYEIKFDGYRIVTRIKSGKATLFTRRGHDWTAKMPALAAELGALGLDATWLDGEIVVMGKGGVPDFNALQNALDRDGSGEIRYFVFDVPFFEGRDLRAVPLRERRRLLEEMLQNKDMHLVQFSAGFQGDAHTVLQSACRMHLEGIIAKRADARYVEERSRTWLKLKCTRRQEFVIGGFTDRKGEHNADAIGSLLVGVHDETGKLRFAGSVGTGWNAKTAADLKKRLVAIETDRAPFVDAEVAKPGRWTRRPSGPPRWVAPKLVAEVNFSEWTPDAQLRHASFIALRDDKPAQAITREAAVDVGGASSKRPTQTAPAAIKVSHPERVIDPSTGLTKLDLVRYYESVASFMLPHLQRRPCSLVRGPSGIKGQLFFQKHLDRMRIAGVRQLDAGLWPGHQSLIEIATTEGIAAAAQMNVIEFHTWNTRATSIDRPDRVVFDLDPGEGLAWKSMLEGAQLTRALLQELGLQSWLKTSGGKGLHVVVPIAPRRDWETVRAVAQALVEQLARVIPDRFVAKSGAPNRVGRIFVDYLRNTHGATTAAAYSARARPGLGVSMPVPWEDLASLKSGAQWTIANAREHLSFQKSDPWADYWTSRQTLTAAMKALRVKPVQGD